MEVVEAYGKRCSHCGCDIDGPAFEDSDGYLYCHGGCAREPDPDEEPPPDVLDPQSLDFERMCSRVIEAATYASLCCVSDPGWHVAVALTRGGWTADEMRRTIGRHRMAPFDAVLSALDLIQPDPAQAA